ncbi:MAG: hypothetical protein M1837_002677 [Sclerophora amabilis]|nr:MAG: hypothetical protein M1837_002677 [Sclerophora amabilis]
MRTFQLEQWAMPFLTFASTSVSLATSACKSVPDSPKWPTVAEWSGLNNSLNGALIKSTPPGAVCHLEQPVFNNISCAEVSAQWTNSSFHAANPFSVDYNDESCYPDSRAPCSNGTYAAYVVNATSAADVKKGVDFAREHNVRLIVKAKGTGHDYPGRSSGGYSLSIWTHFLQGFKYHPSFVPQGCDPSKGNQAATIYAGLQMNEIQKHAAAYHVAIVGGANPSVGLGFLLGGGHGPISAKFGLAADQVLEMEVVTADGRVLVVNERQHRDLFWALRGGGGSTYAVMISATVRVYPAPSITTYSFSVNTTAQSETFWDVCTYIHSQLPHLSDSGSMGYYFQFADMSKIMPGAKAEGVFLGTFLLPDLPVSAAEGLFQPILDYVRNASWPDQIVAGGFASEYPDFYTWWSASSASEGVGTSGRLGSRLLDKAALLKDPKALKKHLKETSPGDIPLLGHLIAGRGVQNAKPAGGDDAINPAWRKAYTHVVLPASWPLLNQTAKADATSELTNERVAALRRLAPDSGAYVNEADPDEPDWQHAFWGDHYERLFQIKQKWDPNGVFYCHPCVGSELWKMVNGVVCKA